MMYMCSDTSVPLDLVSRKGDERTDRQKIISGKGIMNTPANSPVAHLCLCAYPNGSLDENGQCAGCCPFGKQMDIDLKDCISRDAGSAEFKKIVMKWRQHGVEYHGFEPLVTTHTGNGAPVGAFAFTLTMSPSDGLTEADMVSAVRKIMSQKSCPVVKYAWYLEYGEPETKSHPHIHGMYETAKGGVIEKKHWVRAWKIWDPSKKLGAGFRGGYHRPVRSEESYSQYIAKQNILGESQGC